MPRLPIYIGIDTWTLLPQLVIENPGWEFRILPVEQKIDGFKKISEVFPWPKDRNIRYAIHCREIDTFIGRQT